MCHFNVPSTCRRASVLMQRPIPLQCFSAAVMLSPRFCCPSRQRVRMPFCCIEGWVTRLLTMWNVMLTTWTSAIPSTFRVICLYDLLISLWCCTVKLIGWGRSSWRFPMPSTPLFFAFKAEAFIRISLEFTVSWQGKCYKMMYNTSTSLPCWTEIKKLEKVRHEFISGLNSLRQLTAAAAFQFVHTWSDAHSELSGLPLVATW